MPNPAARPLPSPLDDAARLAALDRFGILDTGPDAALDSLVQLAAAFCEAPIALVTLVDDVRQVFKAKQGFDGDDEAPLHVGYCPAVVEQGAPIVIPDTLADPAYASNPAAQHGGMRFYAGVPLLSDSQQVLGTLCVLDKAPRPGGLTPQQLTTLQALATQVISQFELRRTLVQQQAVIRERDALADVQAAIVAAAGDLDTILAALIAGAMQAVPAAEAGVIELIDGDQLEYRTVSDTLAAHRGLRVPLNGSLAGSCALTNAPILVDDVTRDPRAGHDLIGRLNLRSAVFAPIARGDQVLGVLKLQSSQPGRFTAHDLQLVRLFAGSVTAGLTEVRIAEVQKAVQVSEARYRAIFESAGDFAIVVTDPDGHVTEWNGGAERVMGWSAAEMRGQSAERFFIPEDRANDRIAVEMRQALAEGRASDERWHLKKSGERFFASGEMMPLRNALGTHLGFIKILRDRTEQHEAGRLLAASEERYRTLFDTIDEGFCVIRFIDGPHGPMSDYVHVEANPAFEQHLGVPHVAGQTLRDIAPDEAEGWLTIYGDVLRTGQPIRFEREFVPTQRLLEVAAHRVEPASRREVAVLFTDVTARRRAETALRETEERLTQAFAVSGTLGWFDWDIPSDRVRASDSFARIFGVDPARAATGAPIAEFFAGMHPDDRERVGAEVQAAMANRTPYDTVYRLLGADGTVTWVHALGRVAYDESGQPVRFTGIATDETRTYQANRRQAALFKLSERLRDGGSIDTIALVGARVIGEVLGVGWVGYGTVAADGTTFLVEQDWRAPGVSSLAGSYRMDDYGVYAEDLRQGRDVVITDTRQDPRTAANAGPLERVAVRALINLPIIERSRIVAVLYINADQPRVWDLDEVAFARQVAELVRQATERRRAEEQQRLLNRELSHRLKNTLSMVQAIATQTLRNTTDPEAARDALAARLIALGKAHDILMTGTGESADLAAIITDALAIHDDKTSGRFRIKGPPVECSARAALSVALMVHELATNAAKYGALSTAQGQVALLWETAGQAGAETLTLTWREHGGPRVSPPSRKGFGSRLIERGLAGAVGGTVTIDYPPEGVLCTLVAPLFGFQIDG